MHFTKRFYTLLLLCVLSASQTIACGAPGCSSFLANTHVPHTPRPHIGFRAGFSHRMGEWTANIFMITVISGMAFGTIKFFSTWLSRKYATQDDVEAVRAEVRAVGADVAQTKKNTEDIQKKVKTILRNLNCTSTELAILSAATQNGFITIVNSLDSMSTAEQQHFETLSAQNEKTSVQITDLRADVHRLAAQLPGEIVAAMRGDPHPSPAIALPFGALDSMRLPPPVIHLTAGESITIAEPKHTALLMHGIRVGQEMIIKKFSRSEPSSTDQ